MGAALALAIMLVVVVGILSLAVNAQGPFQGPVQGRVPGQGRASHPGRPTSVPSRERPPRRTPRERPGRERQSEPGPPPGEPQANEPAVPVGDLRPLNSQAQALVISVVDERTLGPVTRCRLTLRVEPPGGEAFEVTTRVAFPTPEERAKVKVGGTIPVRYDEHDHRRVVVDMGQGE